MNKIMKLVLDIMQLGVEISKNTKTDVFVEYSGHVDQLSVRIYDDGWKKSMEPYDRYVYLNTETYQEEGIIEILEEIYAELSKYKEELI
jgi:uncharacterized protein (DUF849 family)